MSQLLLFSHLKTVLTSLRVVWKSCLTTTSCAVQAGKMDQDQHLKVVFFLLTHQCAIHSCHVSSLSLHGTFCCSCTRSQGMELCVPARNWECADQQRAESLCLFPPGIWSSTKFDSLQKAICPSCSKAPEKTNAESFLVYTWKLGRTENKACLSRASPVRFMLGK